MVRNSIGSEYRSFTPGVESSSLSGRTKKVMTMIDDSTLGRVIGNTLEFESDIFSPGLLAGTMDE